MAAGMSISFISMLLNSNDSYHIEVDSPNHTLCVIKEVFCIPDDKITISIVNSLTKNIFWELSDIGKFTSPYFSPDFIDVTSEKIKLNTNRNKPYIALAMYQDFDHLQNFSSSDYNWPNNRYRSLDEYSFLFKLIKQAGYEIITLDNQKIPFAEKIRILNNYVDGVIGYEGGLCHIAHVLQIPCIILPWNIPETFLNVHALHLDLKTWFVHEFNDIKNWDSKHLLDTIDRLQNNLGNNIFATGQIEFKKDFSEYILKTNAKEYSILSPYRDFEVEFFKRNLSKQQFFGKPLVFSD